MPNISDIFAEARALVDATSTSYTDAVLLRRVNSAYEEIVGDLIAQDKNWKFDDSNYTDLPIGTADLVDGQQSYAFNGTLLTIDRVEVLDNDGNGHKLIPIREEDIDEALDEYEETDGLPSKYIKKYNSLFLYPAPATASVTLADGLIIYYRRTADLFTTAELATGTKTPGFASPYHYLLSYKSALPYALSYKKDRVKLLREEIDRMHAGLMALASVRDADKLPRLQPNIENTK